MTNYEWLNINNLYDTFITDYHSLLWHTFVDKYRLHYNPKSEYNDVQVILNWLNSKHTTIKKCIDRDALIEYIEDNDTSNNEDYYRICINDFLKFVDMLDVHEIEV